MFRSQKAVFIIFNEKFFIVKIVLTKKCLLTNCNKNINEVPNRIACMCFERSKGIQKCRWNKKPKCIGKVIKLSRFTPFEPFLINVEIFDCSQRINTLKLATGQSFDQEQINFQKNHQNDVKIKTGITKIRQFAQMVILMDHCAASKVCFRSYMPG